MMDVDRPIADDLKVTPKLYDYAKQAGQWMQGRGQNVHGVTDPRQSAIQDPAVEYTDPDNADYIEDYPEPDALKVPMDPIPVEIVNPVRPAARRRFRTFGPTVPPNLAAGTNQPIQVVGQDESILRVTISVPTGGAGCYITHNPSANPADCWLQAAGGSFATESTDAIYVLGAHATDVERISVLVEYASLD